MAALAGPDIQATGRQLTTGHRSHCSTAAASRGFQEHPFPGSGAESHDSPIKVNLSEPEEIRRRVAQDYRQSIDRSSTMRSYLKGELQRQMDERSRTEADTRKQIKDDFVEWANTQDVQQAAEDETAKHKDRQLKEKFRQGLAEQMAELQQRARDTRIREARSVADMGSHLVWGFTEDDEAQRRRKKKAYKHMMETLQDAAASKTRKAEEKQRDYEDSMRAQKHAWELGVHEIAAQKARMQAVQQTLDKRYQSFQKVCVEANAAKKQAEDARIEQEARVQEERFENMYARREAARERQRQVVMMELDAQVQARALARDIDRYQKEAELGIVSAVTLDRGDRELVLRQTKRRQEEELQRELCKQMAEKLEREGNDPSNPSRRRNLVLSTMNPPPVPGASMNVSAELPRQLQKPLGRAEPGGLSQLDASTGELRKLAGRGWEPSAAEVGRGADAVGGAKASLTAAALMSQSDPSLRSTSGRLVPSAHATQSRVNALQRKLDTSRWADGLTAADMKAGRKAATRRAMVNAIRKDPIADITAMPVSRRA